MFGILTPVHGKAFFESVADALVNFLPPTLREFSSYTTSNNLKLWYGDIRQEHYEVQLLSQASLRGVETKVSGPALEIGFHAEYKEKTRNEDLVQRLLSNEKKWRKTLGRAVQVGPFIGAQSGSWRRVSELWEDTGDPDAAIEAAERLAIYIRALEPLRTG
jgi:hypothetical protein